MSAYHQPATLDDALSLLANMPAATLLAGGTDVYPARTARRAWGHVDDQTIVDISALSRLRGIEDRGDHWWLGALATWTDILRAPLPPLFNGLKAAAREIGGAQIQNRGTIAGNCATASPAGDSIPCLLALDATFEIAGPSQRLIPAAAFFTGYRKTALASGELITGIRIPKQSGVGVFRKFGARRYLVISITMVSAVIACDRRRIVTSARVAVGACAATAQRLPSLEAALSGKAIDPHVVTSEHFLHLDPIDDIRASAAYRRHAAIELTRTVLTDSAAANTSEAANA